MHIRMDWTGLKFDWNRARAFLVTAEEGSLSAAARALGTTQPTLGRQVAALEDELGVVLFERVGRGLSLTPSGLDLLEQMRAMGDAAQKFSLMASGRSQTIEGTITISAAQLAAVFRLPKIISKLRNKHPGINVEIIVDNAVSDLQRREADIAIRSFHPEQPNLISKKIRDVDIYFYGAQGYVEAIGYPKRPEDITGANFIGFDRNGTFLKALAQRGFTLTEDDFPLISSNQLLHWEMVKQGLGLAVFPQDIGDNEPGLVRVFPNIPPVITIPMCLVSHRELKTSRRVRLVFDLLAKELAKPFTR